MATTRGRPVSGLRIVVVGAGIGGLAAAGLLYRRGHEVTIVERASAFGEVGAGIQISPNGGRVLAELGLSEQLARIGTTPERIVLRRWEDDSELLVRPLGDAPAKRYGMPYYNVYRPDLINVLAERVADLSVRFGSVVIGVEDAEDSAVVKLADGDTLTADLVVGADGINSAVRQSLFGDHPTRFSGWVAYRALVDRSVVSDLPIEVGNRLGPTAHLVSYFVGQDQRFLNLVCVVREPHWTVESWTEPGDLATLRAYFSAWSPELNTLLDHVAEPVFKWALHDRTPLERWSDGHVTLLGDACHPMVPFMAQGACQALEDAAVLARSLDDPAGRADIASRLAIYERTRRPRTNELQARSFDNATTYHFADGPEQRRRDEFFATLASTEGAGLEAMDKIYGYNALTVELAGPSSLDL